MNTLKKFALAAVMTTIAGLPVAGAFAAEITTMQKPAETHKAVELNTATGFEAADKDHSGALSLKEYSEGLGEKETKQVKDRFASLDKNKDNKLEQAELASKI